MRRSSLAALAAVGLLTGCRLDTSVRVEMNTDGTGTVTVTAVADAELMERIPNPDEQLRFGDAEAAGWTVEGPTEGDDGGATIVLSHPFSGADDATALLNSVGGPLGEVSLTRVVEGEDAQAMATNAFAGTAVLADGFRGFADQALVDAVGGTPFAKELGGQTPADSMTVELEVSLPGDIGDTNGERDGRTARWQLPLDGTEQALELKTRQEPGAGGGWARPLATAALLALLAWLTVSIGFIGYRVATRSRRSV